MVCFRPAFCAGLGWPSIMEPCSGPLWLTLSVLKETSREPMQGSSERSHVEAANSEGGAGALLSRSDKASSCRRLLCFPFFAGRPALPVALPVSRQHSTSHTLDVWYVSAESPCRVTVARFEKHKIVVCFRPAFCAGLGWPSIMEPCSGPLWLTLCVLQEASREPMKGS